MHLLGMEKLTIMGNNLETMHWIFQCQSLQEGGGVLVGPSRGNHLPVLCLFQDGVAMDT